MIHEILLSVIADTEEEAAEVTAKTAEQFDLDATEVSIQMLRTDPDDIGADLIDAVLMQSRLGQRANSD